MTQDARTHQYGLTIREFFAKDIFCAFIARGHRFEKARKQAIEQADLLLAELAKTGEAT